MLRIHPSAAALQVAGLAVSIAQAQVAQVAYTTDDDDPFGARNTDAGLSVNDEAVVTTANMRVSIFSRSGSLLDDRQVGDTDWPFLRADTSTASGPSRYFDPQTVYHPQSGRLWMLYSEENFTGGSGQNNVSALHIAVSKDVVSPNALDSFGVEDWWYYSGTSSNTDIGFAGHYFDLQDGAMNQYRDDDPALHLPFGDMPGAGLVDKPHMAIDEQAAYITMNGKTGTVGDAFNVIVIIPTSHGTGGSLSILDGEKPAGGHLVFLRNTDLPVEDTHDRHYTVQEPFQQVENAQFILSLSSSGATVSDPANSIRWLVVQRFAALASESSLGVFSTR